MDPVFKIGPLKGLEELPELAPRDKDRPGFAETLKEAVVSVDRLQKESEVSQAAFAAGEDVELHDVLIKIEEADVAFRTMMEIRRKLIDAYKEIIRMGA